MAPRNTIWYHLGYALERARPDATSRKEVVSLSERRAKAAGAEDAAQPAKRKTGRKPSEKAEATRVKGKGDFSLLALPGAEEVVSAAMAMAVDRVLGGWGKRRDPTLRGLLRAGVAGAAAALLVDLLRPILEGRWEVPAVDRETPEHMLTGVAQGLVYGGVVEPRLPGPALLKGAVYGSIEYAADPAGGLSGLLGSHAPHGRVPVLSDAIDGLDSHDRAYLEHVLFGIALALIYESSPSSKGILPDDE